MFWVKINISFDKMFEEIIQFVEITNLFETFGLIYEMNNIE